MNTYRGQSGYSFLSREQLEDRIAELEAENEQLRHERDTLQMHAEACRDIGRMSI